MSKRIVVCLDGTWNTPDGSREVTNVVKMMRAIRSSAADGTPQIAFYDAGVGTAGGRFSRAIAGAFGKGLDENIRDGYRFIAHNYEPGDEIYVFGFSRGAFTARSMVGFISACGLLPKDRMCDLMQAWNLYRKPKEAREVDPGYRRLMETSRTRLEITCLGVWDTVGALGIPGEPFQWLNKKYAFHDAELSDMVRHGFHAVAIDESRGPFQPTLWQKEQGASLGNQVVEQVWFAGAHGNVGGGSDDATASDLALGWMVDRVRAHSALEFDDGFLETLNRSNPRGEIYETRTALYTWSRLHPFIRLIGQHPVKRRFLQRFTERHNRPGDGCEFVNEMIHWSARERFGGNAQANGKSERYEPENLRVALDGGVTVVGPDDQRRSARVFDVAAE